MREQPDFERIIRYSSIGFIVAIALLIAWFLMNVLGVSQPTAWWFVIFLTVIALFFAMDYVTMLIMWVAVRLGLLE